MSIEDCRSTALAALCIPGKWTKCRAESIGGTAEFALWHTSETAMEHPYMYPDRLWAQFHSALWFEWITVSPAISKAIPRSEIGYFKEFMRDELARITASDILRKVAK